MGTVNVVFASVGGPTGAMPAYNGTPFAAENITSSAASAASTNAAPMQNTWARVTAVDAAIYVKTGPVPTAAAGVDWYVGVGSSLDLSLAKGDKVAVIDA